MQLTASVFGETPIFVLHTPEQEPWKRVYGATSALVPGAWVFPGYYPLGLWALNDLDVLTRRARALSLDDGARRLIGQLKAADATYQAAKRQFEAGQHVDLDLPAGWRWHKFDPFDHQRFGIAVGQTWDRHLYLWEMGTGKTKMRIEGVRLRRARGWTGRVLVVCPRVVVPTWQREVATWTAGELSTYHWQADDPAKLERARAADFVIVTYQTARSEAEKALQARRALYLDDQRTALLRKGKHVDYPALTLPARAACERAQVNPLDALDVTDIEADESHMLADFKSGQTRAVLGLADKTAVRSALSGTAADQPLQLYSQLRFLAPGLMPLEYQKFLDAHVVYNPVNKHLVQYYKGLAGLRLRVDSVASRMKKDDCLDLPPQTVVDVPFELGINQKARYNEIVRTLAVTTKPLAHLKLRDEAEDLETGVDALTQAQIEVLMEMPHGAARLGKVLQVTSGFIIKGTDATICDACPRLVPCGEARIRPYTKLCVVAPKAPPRELLRDFENPKLLLFEDLLERILDADPTNKVICWANLTPELDDMAGLCKTRKWPLIRIDGETTKDIEAMQDRFQTDPACRVSIGIVSAGVGITLTAANYTIYYALPLKRIHYRQSLDRNNRPGQTRNMTAYRLIGNRTIEPRVAAVLASKEILAETLTGKIDCATCPHAARCQAAGIKPFTPGCVYQSDVARPNLPVTEVT